MEKLNKLTFNGEEYLPKKVLLQWIREISDAVNSFSDRADPIRAQGANKVISLLLEKIEPPQDHWKPNEEQIGALNYAYCELFKRGDVGHNILGPLQKLCDELKNFSHEIH